MHFFTLPKIVTIRSFRELNPRSPTNFWEEHKFEIHKIEKDIVYGVAVSGLFMGEEGDFHVDFVKEIEESVC